MAGTLPPAHLVPFHKGWEWHGGVPFSLAQHQLLPPAVEQDRDRRGQHARALGDGLTSCGRAQCGERLNMGMVHGQQSTCSLHGPPCSAFPPCPGTARPWLLHFSGCCSSGVAHVLAPPAKHASNQGYSCRLPLLPPTLALTPAQLVAALAGSLAWCLPTCCPHSQHVSLALPCLHPATLTHILGSSVRNGCKHNCA